MWSSDCCVWKWEFWIPFYIFSALEMFRLTWNFSYLFTHHNGMPWNMGRKNCINFFKIPIFKCTLINILNQEIISPKKRGTLTEPHFMFCGTPICSKPPFFNFFTAAEPSADVCVAHGTLCNDPSVYIATTA